MPSWIKLAAGWALAAFTAVALSWGAVAQVRDRVVEPAITIPSTAAATVITTRDPTELTVIHVEPESGDTTTSTALDSLGATDTTTATGTTPPTAPPPTAPSGATSTTTQTATTATTSTTTQPPGPTSSTTSQPPGSTTTTTTPAQTTSYTLVGGVVTIRSLPGVVNFISAVPQPGFSTDVRETGPDRVRIRFESEAHNSDFRAEWQGDELRITKNESVEK